MGICVNPSKYGGCIGQYKSYFDAYCKKTCGKCGKSDNGNSGQTPATKKCFDMKTTTKQYGDEISWTFGTCKSSQYKSHNVYTQKCCLAPGKYTLSCKDSYGDGWNGGYLEISGTKVCNDFTTGSEKKVTLNLSGAAGK